MEEDRGSGVLRTLKNLELKKSEKVFKAFAFSGSLLHQTEAPGKESF